MKNSMKTSNIAQEALELYEISVEEAVEYAQRSLNPELTYIKFILTDDKPNSNRVRIPESEFSNLIQSGIYMPIKMSDGEPGFHFDATPLGVIVHLSESKNEDKDPIVVGVAGLWNNEREGDVALIKERFRKGTKPTFSWEIAYEERRVEVQEDKSEVDALYGCLLLAHTLVAYPSYGDRTPITDIEDSTENSEDKQNMSEKEDKVTELEDRVQELETENSELKSEKETLENSVADLEAYKNEKEEEEAEETQFVAIKEQFAQAGVTKDETFFEDNREMLVALSETQLDFFIQNVSSDEVEEESKENAETKNKKKPIPKNLELDLNKENAEDDEDGPVSLKEKIEKAAETLLNNE